VAHSSRSTPEWFEEWFGEQYLQLYTHRDEADAERAIALVRRVVSWRAGLRVLDLGAGAGRHTRVLTSAGAWCVALDLSAPLLRRAREKTSAPLVRGDMRRLPFRERSFDLAVNLFTSFGYFAQDAEHAAVIAGVARTLRPGGHLVLDFLNADTVRAALAGGEASQPPSQAAAARRLSEDGRFVLKTIRIPADRTYTERVRLLGPGDLAEMFRRAGLVVERTFGDYDGRPLEPGTPRAILVGRAA
jgi:SAM-dependent methyltransferase